MNNDVVDVGSTTADVDARRSESDGIVLPKATGAVRAVARSNPVSIRTYDAEESSIHPMYVYVERGDRVSASFDATRRREGVKLCVLDNGEIVATQTYDPCLVCR